MTFKYKIIFCYIAKLNNIDITNMYLFKLGNYLICYLILLK